MLIGDKKSAAALLFGKAMLEMQKMTVELKERRYYLERNVERRTEHLLRRIAVLESCNATLCDKLAMVHKAAPKPADTLPDSEPTGRGVKLYLMNEQTMKQIGSDLQDKWSDHVAAA